MLLRREMSVTANESKDSKAGRVARLASAAAGGSRRQPDFTAAAPRVRALRTAAKDFFVNFQRDVEISDLTWRLKDDSTTARGPKLG